MSWISAPHLVSVSRPKCLDFRGVFQRPDQAELRDGASLGVPSTGGREGRYEAVPKSTEQDQNGPSAVAVELIAPDTMSAFTITFRYCIDDKGPDLQVCASGFMLLLVSHIPEGERGAPRFQRRTLVEGRWTDGKSMPPRRDERSVASELAKAQVLKRS